jgi:hypothetical protein
VNWWANFPYMTPVEWDRIVASIGNDRAVYLREQGILEYVRGGWMRNLEWNSVFVRNGANNAIAFPHRVDVKDFCGQGKMMITDLAAILSSLFRDSHIERFSIGIGVITFEQAEDEFIARCHIRT